MKRRYILIMKCTFHQILNILNYAEILMRMKKVLDSVLGWLTFRDAYKRSVNSMCAFLLLQLGWKIISKKLRSTWEYLRALLRPKFLLSSASLSDASLSRVCGMIALYFLFYTIMWLMLLSSLFSPQDTLGIEKKDLLTFFSTSNKRNIFLQLRFVKKFEIR